MSTLGMLSAMPFSGSTLPCRLKQLLPDFFVRIEGELSSRAEALLFQNEPSEGLRPKTDGMLSLDNCARIRLVSAPQEVVPNDSLDAVSSWELLARSEPWLGRRRILTLDPLTMELWVNELKYQERALDTAWRLAVLLYVWKRGGLLIHATGLCLPAVLPPENSSQTFFSPSRSSSDKTSDMGIVGLAVSGGGKSTLTDLAQGFQSLSDETVALIPTQSGHWHALGTAFRSSSMKPPQTHRRVRLCALLLLKKSPTAHLESSSPVTKAQTILGQTYLDPEILGKDCLQQAFRRVVALARSVQTYDFFFPKASEVATALLHQALLRSLAEEDES